MASEYDGRIGSIDLPCSANLEIQFSVITDEHCLGHVEHEWKNESGDEFHLRVFVYEKYLGDEEHSDVPIIKYLPKEYSPAHYGHLRVRPVNYYRNLKAEARGVGDALEGCRGPHQFGPGSTMTVRDTDNGPPIMRFDASHATLIDSCSKTFLYCCALYDSEQVLTRESTSAMFGENYTHGSIFGSSKELAKYIGLSFAATIGKILMESGQVPKGDSHTYIWVVHGPVNYLADPPLMLHGINSFFTKPDEEIYRNQNEYRFWLGTFDGQAQPDHATIDLPVPPELVTGVELGSDAPSPHPTQS